MKIKHLIFLIAILFIYNTKLLANIHLPKLISDGMILQRDAKVKIWGWADASEKISVSFLDETYQTTANSDGRWVVVIKPHSADNKPFRLNIKGNNSIEIKNVLFGDVWLCSGQSNMELPMYRVRTVYGIANANNPQIRFFTVPQNYNFKQVETDFPSGSWLETNPKSIQSFSAVAYFFANKINQDKNIPVGIINASLGGSPIEAWMSEEALKKFPSDLKEAYRWRDDSLIKQTEKIENEAINKWYTEATNKDLGQQEHWKLPEINDSDWATMNVPGYWNDKFPEIKNGVVWFRKQFTINKDDAGKAAFLNLGRIVDADSVFINGICVGNITYQYPPRWYNVPENILKEGQNEIVVRLVSNSGKGGFVLDKPYELKVGKSIISLKGEWKIKPGCDMPETPTQTFIRWKPMGLYNAMIAPLQDYAKKGIVWYQGESNTTNPAEYAKLLPIMIADWRSKFSQPNLPFIYAQLPNFMEAKSEPSESNWAMLRESQLKTLSVPNTAMSVNIDLGEWNDIHPLHKKPVGERLASLAEQLAYGDKSINASAPVVTSAKIKKGKIILTFSRSGNCLTTSDKKAPTEFAISGTNGKFEWAETKIAGNKIWVWNKNISHPTRVRYAWADNPIKANLIDKNGNFVSPFEYNTK